MRHSDEQNEIHQHAYDLLLSKNYSSAREIFERLFDGKDTSIAKYLGHICSQKDSSEYDQELARAYYQIAAAGGDAYSQHALGGILLQDGDEREAISWYKCASEQGNAECSYILAGLFRLRSESDSAEHFFQMAVDQGHPLAIQQLAVRYIKGSYGLRKVWKGTVMYCNNFRNFTQYVRSHAKDHTRLGAEII